MDNPIIEIPPISPVEELGVWKPTVLNEILKEEVEVCEKEQKKREVHESLVVVVTRSICEQRSCISVYGVQL